MGRGGAGKCEGARGVRGEAREGEGWVGLGVARAREDRCVAAAHLRLRALRPIRLVAPRLLLRQLGDPRLGHARSLLGGTQPLLQLRELVGGGRWRPFRGRRRRRLGGRVAQVRLVLLAQLLERALQPQRARLRHLGRLSLASQRIGRLAAHALKLLANLLLVGAPRLLQLALARDAPLRQVARLLLAPLDLGRIRLEPLQLRVERRAAGAGHSLSDRVGGACAAAELRAQHGHDAALVEVRLDIGHRVRARQHPRPRLVREARRQPVQLVDPLAPLRQRVHGGLRAPAPTRQGTRRLAWGRSTSGHRYAREDARSSTSSVSLRRTCRAAKTQRHLWS